MKILRAITLCVCLCVATTITLFPAEKAYANETLPGPFYIEHINEITGSGYYIMQVDETIDSTSGYLTIANGWDVFLDLNGKQVTIALGSSPDTMFPIINNGNLTITGNGIISCAYLQVQRIITNTVTGTLHIENGTFNFGGINGACIWSQGKLVIDDGTFTGPRGVSNVSPGVATINSGKFDQLPGELNFYSIMNTGTMTINNADVNTYADVSAYFGAVGTTLGSSLHIVGGNFNATSQHALYVAAETGGTMPNVVIDGGNFVSTNGFAAHIDTSNNTDGNKIQIRGGSFTSLNNTSAINAPSADVAALIITAGSFDPINTSMFDPGEFFPTETGDCLAIVGGAVVENHQGPISMAFNDEHHWNFCEHCGQIFDLSIHTPEDVWFSDGNNHWQVCSVCGFEHHRGEHIDVLLWMHDEHTHWLNCLICSLPLNEGAHVMDVAGIVIVEPTSTTTGLKVFPCEICGFVMNEEVLGFTSPPPPATGDNAGVYSWLILLICVSSTGGLLLYQTRKHSAKENAPN